MSILSDTEDNQVNDLLLVLQNEKCDLKSIRNMCKGKFIPDQFRKQIWMICLGISNANEVEEWNEIYDLPYQLNLREKCVELIENNKVESNDSLCLISQLESILTFYIKQNDCESFGYEFDNSWKYILSILYPFNFTKSQLYLIFKSILLLYIPKKLNVYYDIFRLILLYHEPELCSFLESKKIQPKDYCSAWFSTLFSSCTCDRNVIYALWDYVFQQADDFVIFYIAIVYLINAKEILLSMKDQDKSAILAFINNLTSNLTIEDISDIISICQYYSITTPITLKLDKLVLKKDDNIDENLFANNLCINISVQELIRSKNYKNDPNKDNLEKISFFLVDCRPADQYNNGHHPTAFHLDATLMLQDATKFESAILALMAAQKNSLNINSKAGGKHICLMGGGSLIQQSQLSQTDAPEEKDCESLLINMVASHFLRKCYKYISILREGYAGLHEALKPNLKDNLSQHNSKKCLICTDASINDRDIESAEDGIHFYQQPSSNNNLLGKFSSVMKIKTKEMKQRFSNYIVSSSSSSTTFPNENRYLSPLDLHNKQYRNRPDIFSLADDEEYDASSDDMHDTKQTDDINPNGNFVKYKLLFLSIEDWIKKLDSLHSFPCYYLVKNNNFPSLLLVTCSHIYVLKNKIGHSDNTESPILNSPSNREKYMCSFSRPLSSIVKITSRKRNPEIITFKYGRVLTLENSKDSYDRGKKFEKDIDGDYIIEIDAWDKFYIPNLAGDATKLIKRLIVEQMEQLEEQHIDEENKTI
ncbi:unnamed protein product [Gordionus sp. m RMFG-2023]|uniref:TBC1 domain family member 23-like n=1 Tax=Gordionus sp. m RMFG-2023 TaxID=3053472 RepID=UPI0030E44AE4